MLCFAEQLIHPQTKLNGFKKSRVRQFLLVFTLCPNHVHAFLFFSTSMTKCEAMMMEWSVLDHLAIVCPCLILINIHEVRSSGSKLRLGRVLTSWLFLIRSVVAGHIVQKWCQFKEGNRVDCRKKMLLVWKAFKEYGNKIKWRKGMTHSEWCVLFVSDNLHR